MEGQNFIKLNDEDINKLLNINQHQFNSNVKLQLQDSNCQGKQNSNRQGQNHQQNQENINNKIIDFKSRKYEIQKIYQNYRNGLISSFLISRNEQYLVYIVNKVINIYYLKMNKNYKILKQQSYLETLQFTIDSKILFASDGNGFVNGYFTQNDFKTFYKQKIHQKSITQIIVQKQYLITASQDASIIKTSFIKKNQMFKLVGHSNIVTSLDYDDLKNIMVSTSSDKTLKVWDCINQSILFEHNPEQYDRSGQIQLINDKQDLLRCDFSGLQKFAIDYQNKKLIEIYSYIDKKTIFRFQQVNNDQNLLLIFYDNCKILNNQGELIVKINHKLNLNCLEFRGGYREQLDNLNYIVLQDSKLLYYKKDLQLYLLRAKYKN